MVPIPFPHERPIRHISMMLILSCLIAYISHAQVNVTTGIEYKQISQFETDYSITTMKISGDGTKIVFATGGPQVKVFTMDSDGTDLTQIYDFQRTGTGPFVDISAGGDKVIWCDREGEIYISNSDGTDQNELATLLPNPDTSFADMEPVIPLPPRITADGTQVFFIHAGRDPRGSGVWRVNSDDSDLTMIFNYLDMAADIFGTDGAEYNYNTAFADGFDISADGSRMIVGTRIFKLLEGDLNRGDAIAVDGTDFHHIGDYATGNQPFATYVDGDLFTIFRLEYDSERGDDVVNIYFVPLGTGDPVKVIGGVDKFGSSAMTQMASDGNHAIVFANNGRLPITWLERTSRYRLDLVSIDRLTISMGGYRFSGSRLPSITWDGHKFCFLSTSIPPQIWIGTINSDATDSKPSITEITFEPDEVAIDRSTSATVTAHVFSPGNTIHAVTFDAYQDGEFKFRALTSDYPASGFLLDDGTFGDEYADDQYFTNNTVKVDLTETPLGTYSVRIAAADNTLRSVSAADAEPFKIVESTVSTMDRSGIPGFSLQQNAPNPFHQSSIIYYEIPEESHVWIQLVDLLGRNVKVLVNEQKTPGRYSIELSSGELQTGIYFCSMKAGDYSMTRKLQVRE